MRGRNIFAGFLFLVLVLVGLEAFLRLAPGTEIPSLFTTDSLSSQYLRINPQLTGEFSHQQLEVSTSHDLFLAKKRPNTIRIVVQGEGAAAGYPYYYGGAFGKMVETWLQAAYPNKHVEVINTALLTHNLLRHRHFAPEIEKISPDLIIYYGGHHELHAEYLENAHEPSLKSLEFIRNRGLDVLSYFFDEIKTRPGLYDRFITLKPLPYSSDEYRRRVKEISEKFENYLAFYHDKNIPVMVISPAGNLLDFPPLLNTAIENQLGIYSFSQYDNLTEKVQAGQETGLYLKALQLKEAGFQDSALVFLAQLRDSDWYHFRGHSDITSIFEKRSKQYGFTFINPESLIYDRYGLDGLGNKLFISQGHLNLDGNFFLSELIVNQLMTDGSFGFVSPIATAERIKSVMPHNSIDQFYGELVMAQNTLKWPYHMNGYRIDSKIPEDENSSFEYRLAQERFNKTINHKDVNLLLANRQLQNGNLDACRKSVQILLAHYPNCPKAFFIAAELYAKEGRSVAMIKAYESAYQADSRNETLITIITKLIDFGYAETAVKFASLANPTEKSYSQIAGLLNQVEEKKGNRATIKPNA